MIERAQGIERNPRSWTAWAMPAAIGLAGGTIAILFGGMPKKYIVAMLIGAGCLPIALLLMRHGFLDRALLFVFALSIPLNIQKNFFYRPHVGGAPAITITLSMLIALLYLFIKAGNHCVSKEFTPKGSTRFYLVFPVLYGVAGVLSLINADDGTLVFFELIRIISLIAICFLFLNLRNEKAIKTFLVALTFGLFIESVLAIVQYAFNTSIGVEFLGEEELVRQKLGYMHMASRATGTIGHPNILGYYFEILIPLALGLFISESSPLLRSWYAIVFILAMFGIVTTLSRGAWISLPVSLSVVLLALNWGRLLRLRSMIGMAFFGIAAVLFVLVAYPTIEKRIFHQDYKSAGSRMPLNEAAFSIVAQHPVVGIGLNNFSEVFKRYDTTGKSRIFKGYKQVVHNMYLLVWTEVGTIGLFTFLGIFLYPIFLAFRYMSRVRFPERGILIGIVAGMIGHMFHGLFDPGFRTQSHISVLVFSLLGVLGAVIEKSKDSYVSP